MNKFENFIVNHPSKVLDWLAGLPDWAFFFLIVLPLAELAALPFVILFWKLGWT